MNANTKIEPPWLGVLTLLNGSYVYEPRNTLPAGEQMTETFEYTVTDGTGLETGTLSVITTGSDSKPHVGSTSFGLSNI